MILQTLWRARFDQFSSVITFFHSNTFSLCPDFWYPLVICYITDIALSLYLSLSLLSSLVFHSFIFYQVTLSVSFTVQSVIIARYNCFTLPWAPQSQQTKRAAHQNGCRASLTRMLHRDGGDCAGYHVPLPLPRCLSRPLHLTAFLPRSQSSQHQQWLFPLLLHHIWNLFINIIVPLFAFFIDLHHLHLL